MTDRTRWSWPRFTAVVTTVTATGGSLIVLGNQAADMVAKWRASVVAVQKDVDSSYLDLDLRHADDMAEANERIEKLERQVSELLRINLVDPATLGIGGQ